MILVTGATGNVGGELVRRLADDGQAVRALVRDDGSGLPPGVEPVGGDLNHPRTLAGAFTGVRAAFLLSGYADMPGLLREAERAGVGHVVLLSSGAVVGGDRGNAITAYNMASEDAVRASGLPHTLLRPSGYMSNALGWRAQIAAGDVVRGPFADVPVAVLDPYDLAAVAARVLIDGDHHVGRAHRVTGPRPVRPADQVRVLGEVLGRDLRFEGQTDAEARAEMSRTNPPEYVDAFFRYFSAGEYDDSRVLPTVEEITGRPARTFGDWARAHASAFG